MREGLRSRGKPLSEADKGEALLSKETDKVDEESTKEKGLDMRDNIVSKLVDSGTKEDKCISDSKEETEMDKRDGSNLEECCAGSDIGGHKAVECTDNRTKRSRVDAEGENGDDSGKKQKLKDQNEDGKVHVGSRILRSMSAVKYEGEEDVQGKQIDGDFVWKRTRGIGSEEKSVEVEMEESDDINNEVCYTSDNIEKNKLVDKRGRPPKSQENDEFQKKCGGVRKEEIDQSAAPESDQPINELCNKLNRKRGRPRKSQDNKESERQLGDVNTEVVDTFASQESHQSSNKLSKKFKRKRGRPRKSQDNNESEKQRAVVNTEVVDTFATQESHQSSNKLSKKFKRKRGRPRKSQDNKESEKQRADVNTEVVDTFATQESHQSSNKLCKNFKRKRGRTRKSVKTEVVDPFATRESRQPNNEELKTLKPRRGRPPKARKSILSEKIKSESENNEVNEKLKHEHGRPFRVNKPRKVGELRRGTTGTISRNDVEDLNYITGKNNLLSGNSLVGREYNKKPLQVEKMICSNGEKERSKSKQKAGETRHRRLKRQAVRDKIVNLLLAAGWEIQYRPRNGREYSDAVYVNPEGRTHWSVTLAYRVLKKHYESGGDDSKTFKSGFIFTPVPEEELSILTKVINKERSDKNKKKKKWNKEFKAGASEKRKVKLQKRKLGAVAAVGHMKRKAQSKPLSRRQDCPDGMSGQGAAVSVKGHKRLEAHGRKRCGLMVRNSQDGKASGYVLYNGKRTVLAWMIDLGTVPLDGTVQYFRRRKARAVLKGRISTDGIQCECCAKTFTITEFETHAGGKSCQPFENICLESGSSLLQCQLDSWHKQDESAKKGFHFIDINVDDPNDDTCGICGDGGDLICCDGCTSTFHKSCLEIRKFPSGLWHCIYCLCKFCRKLGGNACQKHDAAALSSGLLTCYLCEEKYHQSCVQGMDATNDDRSNPSFCGQKCKELYERLEMLFGVKHELEGEFSWTFVRRFDVGSDISLSGMPRKVYCNSKVAVALHVMDECFCPMVDHRSGVNLIRNIVYNFGSNFKRLNYSGFFTAILEKGDEIVGAASIRIHGNQLAEMPFIGTRYMYRRQGMCRRLLGAIEAALCSLNVEKLVIPAVSELRGTWTSVFGFEPIEGLSKKLLRHINMMVFPGVDMLQKPLLKHRFNEENIHPIEGVKSTELGEVIMEKKNNIDEDCLTGSDLKDYSETGVPHSGNVTNELAAAESGLLLDGCLNDASDATIQNANATKGFHLSCAVSSTLDGRNVNVGRPLDSSCDSHQQNGDEKTNNVDKCSAGFDLNKISATSVPHSNNIIGEPAAAEPCSLFPRGCLNEASDPAIQGANDTKFHDQGGVISDYQGEQKRDIAKCLDCLSDAYGQTGGEKINKLDERYSAEVDRQGFNGNCVPHASSRIIEPAAAEAVTVCDGCLNETSDIKIHDASNTKCQVQSSVITGNLVEINENAVNLLHCSCNGCEQTEGITGQQNALSASILMPTDCPFNQLQGQSNQHNVSEMDNDLYKVSHIGSEAANHGGEFHASIDCAGTIPYEVKVGGSNGKLNPVHTANEVIAFQSQVSLVEHGVKVSNKKAAHCESIPSNVSCILFQSVSAQAHQGTLEPLNSFSAALPIEQNSSSSCQSNGSVGLEAALTLARANCSSDDPSHVVISDITTKPNLHVRWSNAPFLSTKVGSGCGSDLKPACSTSQKGTLSPDGGLISGIACLNPKSSKHSGSDSDIEKGSVTQSNSESSCSLSTVPAISLHCATGGGNSCAATEAVILSNQAN